MKRKCVQCGKEFFLSSNEINFYKSKKLSLPKRCKECRDKNRKNKENENITPNEQEVGKENPVNTYEYKNGDTGTAKPGKKGKNVKAATFAAAAVIFVSAAGIGTFNNANTNGTVANTETVQEVENSDINNSETVKESSYRFKNEDLLMDHYVKHGQEMGFASAEEYEAAASAVVENENALHKYEKEDGDDVYYIEKTNEFVIVSKEGFIRTYFYPNAGKSYFERQ